MLRLIQPAEVLEHNAPLLRRESAQLVPRRVTNSWACAGRPRQQRGGDVDAVGSSGRAAGALFLLVRLVAGEAAAGIEQLAIEPLLPRDRAGVEPARLELPRQFAGFLRQRAGGTGVTARLQRSEEHTSELQSLAYLVCRL